MNGSNKTLNKNFTLTPGSSFKTTTATSVDFAKSVNNDGSLWISAGISGEFTSNGYSLSSAYVLAKTTDQWTNTSNPGLTSSTYIKVTVSSISATVSRWTSSGTKTFSYPKGKSFSGNNIASESSIAVANFSNTYSKNTSDITLYVTISATLEIEEIKTSTIGGSSVIDSATRIISGNFTLTAPRCVYTLTYLKEDGSVYGTPLSKAYNSTITIQNGYSKSASQGRGNGEYTVAFNTNGGTSVDSRSKPWSWSNTTTYEFSSWGGYPPRTIYTFRTDTSLKATFRSSTSATTWNYQTFGSLPTTYKKGYESTNVWYYSNGTIVNPSDQVKESITVYCKWENPKLYQIKFNLNGGKIPEEYDQKINNYTVEKTYGVNVIAPPFTPYRLGYTFTGWSNQTGSLAKVQPNGAISDVYYNEINTPQTNTGVTLWAQWTPKVNTLKCNYYLTDDGDLKIDVETYTIERADKIVVKNAPSNLRDGDFAFLGWCDEKPRGWDDPLYTNNGYRGTYTIPPEKIIAEDGHELAIELPIKIDINKLNKLEDWGTTEVYYGVWAKSGKRIKIGNSWRKVVKSFVKINGDWKTVTDIWTKNDDSWHHEI